MAKWSVLILTTSKFSTNMSSIWKTGLQHIFPHFPHFHTYFHIFPSLSLHFPNSCHKLQCSKEKMRLPKTLLMDTLILNLKPFVSESSKKAVPQNIFPKLLYFPALRHESFS